jgi:Ca-activated chloride channel family protein
MSTEFIAPGRLWLLVVIGALGIVYAISLQWRRGAEVRFTEVELLDEVAPQRPRWRRHVVAVLMLAGLAAMAIAAARPVDIRVERQATQGRILVLFDVSLSMMAQDVQPDRFSAAREAALEFIDEVDSDVQIGLISFSGNVAVESPLTLDRGETRGAVDRLALGEGTAIGDALAVATRLLSADSSDADTAAGVIVLLTDGETTVGRPTAQGAALAADAQIPVYAVSFGTEFGFITDPGGSGQRIPVPVRTDEMEQVAAATGGVAYSAESLEALSEAYDDIREALGETLGEPIEVIDEQTWRWAFAAFWMISAGWGLALWWLRGMV